MKPSHSVSVDICQIARDLLRWAGDEGRHFAWRNTSNNYYLAVAEILLQQTKARDVEPVWCELISRFAKPADLANAKDDEIRSCIEPLGLVNQRIRRLKAMADVMSNFELSDKPIPGLGEYGRTILFLSSGMELLAAPIDSNIARIICRVYGLTFDRGETRKKKIVKDYITNFLNTQHNAGAKLALIYGLVDLGDKICKSTKQSCSSCPLAKLCLFALDMIDG